MLYVPYLMAVEARRSLRRRPTGGQSNLAQSFFSLVTGGHGNVAGEIFATVTGGDSNTANGGTSSICGGTSNLTTDGADTVCGVSCNTASGFVSVRSGSAQQDYADNALLGDHGTPI